MIQKFASAPIEFRVTAYIAAAVLAAVLVGSFVRAFRRPRVRPAFNSSEAEESATMEAYPSHGAPIVTNRAPARVGSDYSPDPGIASVCSFLYPPLGFVYLGAWGAAAILAVIDLIPYAILWIAYQSWADDRYLDLLLGRPLFAQSEELAAAALSAAVVALAMRVAAAWAARDSAESRRIKNPKG